MSITCGSALNVKSRSSFIWVKHLVEQSKTIKPYSEVTLLSMKRLNELDHTFYYFNECFNLVSLLGKIQFDWNESLMDCLSMKNALN